MEKKGEQPPTKEQAFAAIFGKKKFQDTAIRLAMSSLFKSLNRFLALLELFDTPEHEQLLSLRQWGHRGLEKIFFQEVRKSREKYQKEKNSPSALFSYLVEAEVSSYLHQNPRSAPSNFQDAANSLDEWYILEKLKLACALQNNRQVLDSEGDLPLLREITSYVESLGQACPPVTAIYYRTLKMFQFPQEPIHYKNLKELLRKNSDKMSEREAREVYNFAQNYCIRRINTGQTEYLEELFLVYESLLEQDLLLDNGSLSPWHVKNISTVALRLKKFDWTERFLEEKIPLVPHSHRQNAYTYNLAKLYFHKRDYSEAKKLLLQVEYNDVFYNLDSKVMLLKVYFEEKEDIALDAFCRTFLAYIRRNKLLSEVVKKRYANLVRYVQKLNRLNGISKEQLLGYDEELTGNTSVADVVWLKKQIQAMLSDSP